VCDFFVLTWSTPIFTAENNTLTHIEFEYGEQLDYVTLLVWLIPIIISLPLWPWFITQIRQRLKKQKSTSEQKNNTEQNKTKLNKPKSEKRSARISVLSKFFYFFSSLFFGISVFIGYSSKASSNEWAFRNFFFNPSYGGNAPPYPITLLAAATIFNCSCVQLEAT